MKQRFDAGRPSPETFWNRLLAVWISCFFLISLIHLGTLPFWVDESITSLPVQSILSTGLPTSPFDLDFMSWQLHDHLWDPATPLQRYALAWFTGIFGFSEFTTRLFSVICGYLTLIPIYRLFQENRSTRIAQLSIALLVASPTFLGFIREARHFSFLMLWVFSTLYCLSRVVRLQCPHAKLWWPIFLMMALLSQVMGYLMVPVVLVYLGYYRKISFFEKRLWWVYSLLLGLYLPLMLSYGSTLALFHSVTCENHTAGCHASVFYYLLILGLFLSGTPFQPTPIGLIPIPFALFFFLGGVIGMARNRSNAKVFVEKPVILWVGFLVPLVILSLREVKFERYLFIYAMPFCSFFCAEGFFVWKSWASRQLGNRHHWCFWILALLILAPHWKMERKAIDWIPHSALLDTITHTLIHGDPDNWQRIRYQVEYLLPRIQPQDWVVTSLDDASLGYYLKRPVSSFLSSQNTDGFFLSLLEKTKQNGSRLWFIDTLPDFNFCLTSGEVLKEIDCREKFKQFYQACRIGSSCRRIQVPPPLFNAFN